MRHILRNSILILAVLAFCMLSVWPPKEKLRLGKDLAGGVSLIYTVHLNPDDPPEVVAKVIEVLVERINPDGLFEIAFVQQGRDRIEITMPLPSKDVQEHKEAYEETLAHFEEFRLDAAALERALRLSGTERQEALRALMTSEARRTLIQPVIEAVDADEQARIAYETAAAAKAAADEAPQPEAAPETETPDAPETATGPTSEELNDLLNVAGEAADALDSARSTAIAASVSPDDIRDTLTKSTDTHVILDENNDPFILPSPRQRAMDALRERLSAMPDGEQALDDTVSALAVYNENRRGLDDPDDLERLLQGAGVLEFRIAVAPGELADENQLRLQLRERGPANVESGVAQWYGLNQIEDWFDSVEGSRQIQEDPAAYLRSTRNLVVEEHDGEYFVLMHDTKGKRLTAAEGQWALATAYVTKDQLNRDVVGFRMDARGTVFFSTFTGANIQQPMGVLLDGRVYTVATIQQRLRRDSIITGTFSQAELQYLIKTLNAGSLQARLSDQPISVSNLAPELGADNLKKGLTAAWISLIVVGVFMVFYYFTCGFVAVLALICNAIIILGAMSLARAAFTLPGIAGIVLTFGMAVDANVLIYERLREELKAGNDLRSAVRIAYDKVLSTIVDANVTNLIICFVLAQTGTQEIRGFAITLGIGVVATMFSSLLITRVIFALLVDHVKIRSLTQLPIALPFIDRLLTPKIDWVGLRWIYLFISIGFVGTGIGFIVFQGKEMLDTEFRGGTAITIRTTAPDENSPTTFAGEPYEGLLTLAQVKSVVDEIATEAEQTLAAPTPDDTDAQALQVFKDAQALQTLRNADILVLDHIGDGVTSNRFQIKTTITNRELLLTNIIDRFAGVVDSKPALRFDGSTAIDQKNAPVFPISDDTLGQVINRPEVKNDISQFVGGVVVLLENLSPPPTEEELRARVDYIRTQSAYISTTSRRTMDFVVVDGDANAVQTAAIVVKDPRYNAIYDVAQWITYLAQNEWDIARDGLAEPVILASVESFSPEIAATFRGRAIVSVLLSFLLITLYIWARFGSLKFSLAAIFPLIHDVIAAIGLIALAEILYDHFPGTAAIGIQPFKIDLGLVAAILTIIGYSLNDTIVILDRIRENRGKLAYASREVVNRSVNETISRSVITSGTTLMALTVMFLIGGPAIASFTYALICGIIVGTYSSIAIAAPLVWTRKIPKAAEPFHRHAEAEAAHRPEYETPETSLQT